MNTHAIVSALSRTRLPRASLYLNSKTIDNYFHQAISAINEVVRAEKLDSKISASLLTVLGFELGGGKQHSGKTTLDPLLKAILIEYEASASGHLIDLAAAEPRAGAMLTHVGLASVVDIDEEVTGENTALGQSVAREIQRERSRQEQRLQRRNPARKTIVWATAEPRVLASVASDEWVNDDYMASYSQTPPFGILGRLERRIGDVIFLAPFWIWHDGW